MFGFFYQEIKTIWHFKIADPSCATYQFKNVIAPLYW